VTIASRRARRMRFVLAVHRPDRNSSIQNQGKKCRKVEEESKISKAVGSKQLKRVATSRWEQV
jgi:hypothetical protein